nr:MAG TPA: hypothetical protein [Caudoviricetes sp.]
MDFHSNSITNNQVEFFMELDPDDPIPDGAPMGSDGLPF